MANIEALVIEWLGTVVSDYPVSGDKPTKPPEKFILVDRTGGPRESMVLDQAEILIEVYHKNSRVTASNKANEIADRITDLLSHNQNITRAVVNSVVNLDDTIAQYHRYQVYCDIYYRR
jgi:hypothetical protein